MKKKVNYTKEFKVKACELVLKDDVKVKTVADKMGINHIMLYRWMSTKPMETQHLWVKDI